MRKTVSRPVSEQVRECECKHCQNLLQYLLDDGVRIAQLSYEDVFTPLKHHEIALYVEERGYIIESDMCYRACERHRDWDATIDPFSVWNALDIYDKRGMVRFEVIE